MTHFFAGYNFPGSETPKTHVDGHTIAWAAEHKGVIATEEDLEAYPWPSPEDNDYAQLDIRRSTDSTETVLSLAADS